MTERDQYRGEICTSSTEDRGLPVKPVAVVPMHKGCIEDLLLVIHEKVHCSLPVSQTLLCFVTKGRTVAMGACLGCRVY